MVSQIYNGQIMRLYFMKKYKYTAQLYSSLKTHTGYTVQGILIPHKCDNLDQFTTMRLKYGQNIIHC